MVPLLFLQFYLSVSGERGTLDSREHLMGQKMIGLLCIECHESVIAGEGGVCKQFCYNSVCVNNNTGTEIKWTATFFK